MPSNIAKKRRRVLLMFGEECIYCSCYLNKDNTTVEHLLPKSKDGENSLINLAPACETCNKSRGNADFDIFLQSMPVEQQQRIRNKISFVSISCHKEFRKEYKERNRPKYNKFWANLGHRILPNV